MSSFELRSRAVLHTVVTLPGENPLEVSWPQIGTMQADSDATKWALLPIAQAHISGGCGGKIPEERPEQA